MARWTGTWLTGLGSAGVQPRGGPRAAPGVDLGLPLRGPGAVASFGARASAFAIDAGMAALVGRLFFPIREQAQASDSLAPILVLAVVYLAGLALLGQTPGMRLVRLRVVRARSADGPLGFVPVALRTALLLLLVPALVSDADGRGLHDRAAGTVVVRA